MAHLQVVALRAHAAHQNRDRARAEARRLRRRVGRRLRLGERGGAQPLVGQHLASAGQPEAKLELVGSSGSGVRPRTFFPIKSFMVLLA